MGGSIWDQTYIDFVLYQAFPGKAVKSGEIVVNWWINNKETSWPNLREVLIACAWHCSCNAFELFNSSQYLKMFSFSADCWKNCWTYSRAACNFSSPAFKLLLPQWWRPNSETELFSWKGNCKCHPSCSQVTVLFFYVTSFSWTKLPSKIISRPNASRNSKQCHFVWMKIYSETAIYHSMLNSLASWLYSLS